MTEARDVYHKPIVSSMHWDRFGEIMKFFHAAENTKLPANDNFAKICPLLKIMNGNVLKYGKVFGPVNVSKSWLVCHNLW